jgi:hypothetical protein
LDGLAYTILGLENNILTKKISALFLRLSLQHSRLGTLFSLGYFITLISNQYLNRSRLLEARLLSQLVYNMQKNMVQSQNTAQTSIQNLKEELLCKSMVGFSVI